MNKLILIFLFGLTTNSQAQINDYSNGNSNPFARYNYVAPQEQAKTLQLEQNSQPIQYFSNELVNPKRISKNSNSKYKHLINNADHVKGCWDGAAKAYNLDPWLLMAIAKVESSFNSQAINTNKNKSTDIGMMQINTIWLPTLKKFGISKNDLLVPCTSIFVGAWIMAQNIKNFGYNQDGIGAYNSPRNISIRRNYASKVYKAYHEITNDLYYNNKK
jgi:soluble lytic murein transglycosylase-like protein